jgi:hypothetical protein
MKNIEKLAIIISFQVLIISCGVSNQNNSDLETEVKQPELTLSWFYMFNIHKDNNSSTNIIKLISKKEVAGKMKTESSNRSSNYLTLYLYSGKKLVDTVAIDHPLYKHYEYTDQNGAFTYKDTIIDNADFVLRAQRSITEIRIFETIKNQPKKELTQKNF